MMMIAASWSEGALKVPQRVQAVRTTSAAKRNLAHWHKFEPFYCLTMNHLLVYFPLEECFHDIFVTCMFRPIQIMTPHHIIIFTS